jgi:hypothetical protein
VFGRIDDVGAQLVGEPLMRKLSIIVGEPEAKIVGALLVEGGKKRVGEGGEILLVPAQ